MNGEIIGYAKLDNDLAFFCHRFVSRIEYQGRIAETVKICPYKLLFIMLRPQPMVLLPQALELRQALAFCWLSYIHAHVVERRRHG